jgi:hypothetical protein
MRADSKKVPPVLGDDELLANIQRDLKAIYSDVIRQPLPDQLAAALKRLELRYPAGRQHKMTPGRQRTEVAGKVVNAPTTCVRSAL